MVATRKDSEHQKKISVKFSSHWSLSDMIAE
jgi:hypothetical protein